MKRALMVATVSQSLRFQSPAMLDVLRAHGYEVSFAAREDAWTAKLQAEGGFTPIEGSRRPSPKALMRLRVQLRDLARDPWDLIQTQSPIASAGIRTIKLGSPSIYVAHGFHFHRDGSAVRNMVFRAIESSLAGRTQAIALVSAEDFAAAIKLGLHRRALIWRLPGAGVDLSQFRPAAARVGGERVLFCGELNANKDPLTVIGAVELIRGGGRPTRLTIVGDGALAPAVREASLRHSWLEWFPSLPPHEIAERMRTSNVLAAPSHREGLPRVVIEAVASGTPVVARSNRGSRELLSCLAGQGRSALVHGSDRSLWAKALETQLDAGSLGTEERRVVRQYGLPNFSTSYGRLLNAVEAGVARGAIDTADQSEWGQ